MIGIKTWKLTESRKSTTDVKDDISVQITAVRLQFLVKTRES